MAPDICFVCDLTSSEVRAFARSHKPFEVFQARDPSRMQLHAASLSRWMARLYGGHSR